MAFLDVKHIAAKETCREAYKVARREARSIRPDISIQQFDCWVRAALPSEPTPVDWCQKAVQLLTLIKARSDEANRIAAHSVSDYFGQAGSTR